MLKDYTPYFFLYNIYKILESGKYVIDLFIKRGITLSFFYILLLPPKAACYSNRIEGVAVDSRGIL